MLGKYQTLSYFSGLFGSSKYQKIWMVKVRVFFEMLNLELEPQLEGKPQKYLVHPLNAGKHSDEVVYLMKIDIC